MNELTAALGPGGVCALLAIAGAGFVAGFFFKLPLFYPRGVGPGARTGFMYRIYPLITGVLLIIAGALFYIFRDLVNWN